jgi:glycosyltransferase involved in cell wall biosynthesis
MKKVTVIIPAYNAEKYLAEAIESILAQSFKNFELIIIDDGSRDCSAEVISRYAIKDSRIVALKNPTNLGIAATRNRGLKTATGQYIAWQDADDISMPGRLQLQVDFLDLHPDVGILGGNIEIFLGNSVIEKRKYPEGDSELRKCIYRYSPIAQPTAMIRADLFKRVGNYDLELPPAEDLDMTFRIGAIARLANLPVTLIKYRISDSSATSTMSRKMELNSLKIRFKYASLNGFQMSLGDLVFNVFHFFSIWLIPFSIKIYLFRLFRSLAVK